MDSFQWAGNHYFFRFMFDLIRGKKIRIAKHSIEKKFTEKKNSQNTRKVINLFSI